MSWTKGLLLLGATAMGIGVVAAVHGAGSAGQGQALASLLRSETRSAAAARGAPVRSTGPARNVADPAGFTPARATRGTGPAGSAVSGAPSRVSRTAASAPGAVATRGELVFRLGWGRGAQELGYKAPEEAAPEGPMSFALGPEESFWVLDQVNFRVQVVERGRVVRSIPLLNDTYQDLAVDGRGHLALVDRLVQGHVAWRDLSGNRWSFADIEGPGLPEGGGVTAMFLRPDGVWLEWAHAHLVRVTDGLGRADSRRPIRWGRFSSSGRWLLRAARAGNQGAAVLRRDARSVRSGVEVLARPTFARPLRYLTALGTDGADRVVLGAHCMDQGSAAPGAHPAEEAWALVLGPDGAEERRVRLPLGRGPAVPFQSLRVAPDGSIYRLIYEDRGASLWRFGP